MTNASDLQESPKEGTGPGRPTTAPSKGFGTIFHFTFFSLRSRLPVGATRMMSPSFMSWRERESARIRACEMQGINLASATSAMIARVVIYFLS
jgi:hypothetical protein